MDGKWIGVVFVAVGAVGLEIIALIAIARAVL